MYFAYGWPTLYLVKGDADIDEPGQKHFKDGRMSQLLKSGALADRIVDLVSLTTGNRAGRV